MKYLVYYRVSTKGQGESGLGLEAQQSIVSHFLPADQIAGEYKEVISAKVAPMARPVLTEVILECLKNGYGLAVAKVDRLSRVTEDALAVFNMLDGMIYAADIPMQLGSKMDKFTLTIYMAIADRERELIGIRTKAALGALKERGKELGTPANLNEAAQAKGLQIRRKNARQNKEWVKAAEYAGMMRDKGETLAAIASTLNRKGFVTRRGKEFAPITVSRLLGKI